MTERRRMTDEDVDKLSIAIARALQQARSVSDSEHYDHHVFIAERIKQVQESRKFWEDMRKHITRWGVLSVLSFLFYAVWLAFKAALKVIP